jgi:hypothetical protein
VKSQHVGDPVGIAKTAIAAATAVIVLLAALHVLSPEFDQSYRVVSEYANGQHAWVLSLMFIAWAPGSWALAFAIRSQTRTPGEPCRIGVSCRVRA